jgi:uncharacterized protein YhfF
LRVILQTTLTDYKQTHQKPFCTNEKKVTHQRSDTIVIIERFRKCQVR